MSHKRLSSANEKYIAKSGIIPNLDPCHPAACGGLLAAIGGSFVFPARTWGCGSGSHLWEDELISKSSERIQGETAQLLIAVQHLELAYHIKLSPAGQAGALCAPQAVNPAVIPALMSRGCLTCAHTSTALMIADYLAHALP